MSCVLIYTETRGRDGEGEGEQYQTTYITEVALFITALGLNYIISPSQENLRLFELS